MAIRCFASTNRVCTCIIRKSGCIYPWRKTTRMFSSMKDEYGSLDSSGMTYHTPSFQLESGVILSNVEVCYNTYGALNASKDNVMVICHALTGNSKLSTWWGEMLGPGKAFDTSKYLVVCANVLGSCYGTTGPLSINPLTGSRYGMNFPKVTIRDSVRLHMQCIKENIGATGISSVIGGSMGGMQALEWAIIGQGYVRSAVVIGCGAQHTAWQIAISEAQRQAIYIDPKWNDDDIDINDPPIQGLSVARQMAMISYRSASSYQQKFGRHINEDGDYEVKSYLMHQGKKFVSRFDALTYVKLTEKLDSHDVGRGRGGIIAALTALTTPVLIIGIESDVLYPIHEQQELAKYIPHNVFKIIPSSEGHDGFLLEQEMVSEYIQKILETFKINF